LGTRHSPRPLFFWGASFMHSSGVSRRENAELCLPSLRGARRSARLPTLRLNLLGCLKFESGIKFTSSRPSEARAGTHSHRCRCYVWLEPQCLSPLTSVAMGPGVRRDDREIAHSTRWLAMTVSSGCLKFESASTPLRTCGGGCLEQFLAAGSIGRSRSRSIGYRNVKRVECH
jgi:hypothetical protein